MNTIAGSSDTDAEWEAEVREERRVNKEIRHLGQRVALEAGYIWHQGDGHGGAVMRIIANQCVEAGLEAPEYMHVVRPDVERLAARDGWTCHYCAPLGWGHALVMPPEVEHMVPKSRGGSHALSNKVLSCQRCNRDKSTQTHDEYCHPFSCPGIPPS